MKRTLTQWRHDLSEAAMNALDAEFEERELETAEDRVAFVKSMLGNVENILDKDRPFLWQSRDSPNPEDWSWVLDDKGKEVEQRSVRLS